MPNTDRNEFTLPSEKNKKRYSIFFKLSFVITVTGILIGCAFIIFIRLHFSLKVNERFNSSIENYYYYIAKDIGSPPDTLLAKKIADKYFIAMVYQGNNTAANWHYGNIDYELASEIRHFLSFIVGFWREAPVIIKNNDGSRFIFTADFHRILNPNPYELLFFMLSLVIILSMSYLVIRNILKRIKQLSTGVEEVSKGNLEYKVAVSKNDELTMLSRSFNEMTKRIREMIESKNQLLLDVSHELRSPITRIKIALQLIDPAKDNPVYLPGAPAGNVSLQLEKNLGRISSDIKELETMITELLESERLQDEHGKLRIESYSLKKLLDEVLAPYDDTEIIPEIHSTEKNTPADLYLSIDAERIKIVLKNIIDNSIKFSRPVSQTHPEGTENIKQRIYISAEEMPGLHENNNILIKIRDNGTGIPDEDLPFIFEPFYRVDKSRVKKPTQRPGQTGGYGLGLSLCKKIVEAHEGRISIANNEGGGVTVTIEIPKM